MRGVCGADDESGADDANGGPSGGAVPDGGGPTCPGQQSRRSVETRLHLPQICRGPCRDRTQRARWNAGNTPDAARQPGLPVTASSDGASTSVRGKCSDVMPVKHVTCLCELELCGWDCGVKVAAPQCGGKCWIHGVAWNSDVFFNYM